MNIVQQRHGFGRKLMAFALLAACGLAYREQDGLLDNPDWSAFYLWKDGEPIAENAGRA